MSGSGGSSGSGGGGGSGGWPAFTVAQWQELEHQALIFKYLKAGLPVPPDLLVPIQRSLSSMSSRFLQYPTLGYYSFYGKKVDPEPGRCRRTDGKKWRCSKDAHPDSKYCERHMNRGRYRSRKPVESQTASQSLSTAALDIGSGSSSGRNFPNLPLHSMTNPVSLSYGSSISQLQVEHTPYESYSKFSELKSESDVHKSLAESSASVRGFEMKSMVDAHNAMSQAPADLPLGLRKETSYQGDYSQLHKLQEYGRIPDDAGMSKQQKQHYFFGMDFSSQGLGKPEQQPIQPFFDEWPETRDSSSYADNQRSNLSSYPSAQLSISIDKVPSEISARGAHSPTDRRGSMCNFQA